MDTITCPVCGMTSWNPNDILHGYCGKCHAFTGCPLGKPTTQDGVTWNHLAVLLSGGDVGPLSINEGDSAAP